MSFILDALKKSEIERQRQSQPGLIDVTAVARHRAIPAWVWVVAGLLAINVVVLVVFLVRSPGLTAPTAGTAAHAAPPAHPRAVAELQPAAQPAPTAEAAPSTEHFSPLDNTPVYAPEIPVPQSSAPDAAAPAAAGRAEVPSHTARRADPVLNDEPSDDDEMLPSISELNLTGNQSLPEIHLDVHVYATRAADRFVYINMRKYREGAVLQEGPTLERIRRDGVVLNYNGLRFFVPRQS
jgi:general secretion pathway protein B